MKQMFYILIASLKCLFFIIAITLFMLYTVIFHYKDFKDFKEWINKH